MIDPDELADQIYEAILEADRERPRSKQTENFVVGISELGFCSERTRRMLAGIRPDVADSIEAFIGTALGDHIESAIEKRWPEAIRQAEVTTQLHGDQGTYNLTGHPDLLFPWGVLDVKTTRGLDVVRRTGPSTQQQYQRHGYALGAWEAGYFGEVPLDEVQVANVWFDRAGDDKGCYVQMEPFSGEKIAEAGAWLDEVVYAYLRGEQARKEPPRAMCEAICGHFLDCRALDSDVEGLITEPRYLAAVSMYREGLALEKDGRMLKEQGRANLSGVNGSTGEFAVRWVQVNESIVPEQKRRAHQKLSITKQK